MSPRGGFVRLLSPKLDLDPKNRRNPASQLMLKSVLKNRIFDKSIHSVSFTSFVWCIQSNTFHEEDLISVETDGLSVRELNHN